MRTKAVFVDLEQDIYDRHGVYALSGVLKRDGVDVRYLASRNEDDILRDLSGIRPQFVLYSTYSSYFAKYAAFDRKLKDALDVTSVIGGPCMTFNPGILNESSIDAGCLGEGEKALSEMVLGGGGTAKNIFRRGETPPQSFDDFVDLDAMPFPDRDIIYEADYVRRNNPSKTFISGRGCPFSCTYCFNHKYNKMFKGSGPIVRKKSISYLMEEIGLVKRRYPLRLALFNDDTFIINRNWLFEFCERFPRDIGIPYACNVRANLVDEDIIRALAESGCVAINWSIESGNDFFRNEVMKRRMTKEQILNTGRLLNKYGIRHRIGNVIGLPGETLEQIYETLELNIAARPNLSLANIFVPFPGLELTKYAMENGFYNELPEDKLPLNYFAKSVMNIPKDTNDMIVRIMCLFPIFTRYPKTYFNTKVRNRLLGLPRSVLRLMYEAFYVISFRSMYRIHGGIRYTSVIGSRYVRNLFLSLFSEKR